MDLVRLISIQLTFNRQPATQFNMTALGDFTNLRIRAWGGGGTQQGYPSAAGGFGGGYISGSAGDVLTVATNFGVVGPSPGGGAYGVFQSSKSQPNCIDCCWWRWCNRI